MRSIRELLRLARRIHAAYVLRAAQSLRERQADWYQLEHRFQQVQQQRQRLEKARMHGWHFAANQQQRHLPAMLRGLHEEVRKIEEALAERPIQPPALKDLLAELQNIETEFDTVIAMKDFLSVETEAIVLQGIDLGRFSVRLHWPRLAERTDVECFEVVPLDPHPPSSNEDVPHPHVRNNHLCAGDATLPLQTAMAQGRLTDAFHLIRSVLETYNSSSAYVSLDDWEGVSCWNCGCTTNDDDSYFCDGCEHTICNDCTSTCGQCDQIRCTSCQARCGECDEPCCYRCLQTSACSELSCCKVCLKICRGCSAEVAASELDEATERCPTCQEQATEMEAATSEREASTLVPSP